MSQSPERWKRLAGIPLNESKHSSVGSSDSVDGPYTEKVNPQPMEEDLDPSLVGEPEREKSSPLDPHSFDAMKPDFEKVFGDTEIEKNVEEDQPDPDDLKAIHGEASSDPMPGGTGGLSRNGLTVEETGNSEDPWSLFDSYDDDSEHEELGAPEEAESEDFDLGELPDSDFSDFYGDEEMDNEFLSTLTDIESHSNDWKPQG